MHKSVLLKETIDYLNPQKGKTILDATINGGGHARKILEILDGNGQLIGIEQDAEIFGKLKIESDGWQEKNNFILINGNFRNLEKLIEPYNIKNLDGAIFDLGMSSLQLEESGRGFSFQKNEPLLMTYKSYLEPSDLTAKDILNEWNEEEIVDILFKYGEERYSRRIARGVKEARTIKPIETTFDLVRIIESNVPAPYRHKKIHCATKTFQALRIAVNDEIEALIEGVGQAWNLLNKNGRLVVISFHSLEDRAVKQFFKKNSIEGTGKILTKKPIIASEEEAQVNPRARSAKLRAIEKI